MYQIAIYEFPRNLGRAARIVDAMGELEKELDSAHQIKLRISPVRGEIAFPQFSDLLNRFLETCQNDIRHVDVHWIHYLPWIANDPSPRMVDAIRQLSPDRFDFAVLEKWSDELLQTGEWGDPTTAQILTIDGLWKEGQGGPWGTELGTHPFCTAIIRDDSRESVFHALLHLFGVDEGYEPGSYETKSTCSASCWMQWVPTQGRKLCHTHRTELRQFLDENPPQ